MRSSSLTSTIDIEKCYTDSKGRVAIGPFPLWTLVKGRAWRREGRASR